MWRAFLVATAVAVPSLYHGLERELTPSVILAGVIGTGAALVAIAVLTFGVVTLCRDVQSKTREAA